MAFAQLIDKRKSIADGQVQRHREARRLKYKCFLSVSASPRNK
jgi:hypothetical protein